MLPSTLPSMPYPPASVQKFVTSSDGRKIHARATGNSRKPALVFIHGLALSGDIFDDLFTDERLLSNFYLVSYDMRGFGRSDKPDTVEEHSSLLYANDFKAVSAEFKLIRPILVGWYSRSLGAIVAADVCQYLGSDFISAIIYVSGLPYIGPIMNDVGTPVVLGFLPGLFSEDAAVASKTRHGFVDSLFNKPEGVPLSYKWFLVGCATLLYPKVAQAALSRSQDPSALFEAGAKGVPLLMISGDADKQVRGAVTAKEMLVHFPHAEVYNVKGGSHMPFYEHREEFITQLTRFSKKVFVRRPKYSL
ncbi:Alpha/Beta hydrolase protein [Cyathus striatus]|nr:Alpha/Beta hydrolase protein [Cyathus striatus]